MGTKEALTEILMARYANEDMDSRLDKDRFKELFKEAVKDYYPQLKEEYAGQSIYGISFEIAGVVQKVYANDFYSLVYFNTEEMYEEKIKDCDEDEKDYYRFEPWAEWYVVTPKSSLFEKVQDYLTLNTLRIPYISDYEDGLTEGAIEWYEENEGDFDDAFDEECEQIRMWIAEVLGELRKEGFWDQQGNADIYVIPFSGEGDIDYKEMVETFRVMDEDYHGTEFLDYLAELYED